MTGQLSLFGAPEPPAAASIEPAKPEVRRDGIDRWAVFSPDRLYRYVLGRSWNTAPRDLFILHNPSAASEFDDDPTATRLIARSRTGGAGGMLIVNPWPRVATDPDTFWSLSPEDRIGAWLFCPRCEKWGLPGDWPTREGRPQCGVCFTYGGHVDQLVPAADHFVRKAIASTGALLAVGWGKPPARKDLREEFSARTDAVLEMVHAAGVWPRCLGTNGDGTPKHPLYLSYGTSFELFGGGPKLDG